MIEHIKNGNQLLAVVVPADFTTVDVEFVTDPVNSQQLGVIFHKEGDAIAPHIHRPQERIIYDTQETLIIRKGKVRVNFYSDQQDFLQARVLTSGDIVLLISGGHGFEMIEDTLMVEIKQGPYIGDKDKVRF
jgi:hypothetical protein